MSDAEYLRTIRQKEKNTVLFRLAKSCIELVLPPGCAVCGTRIPPRKYKRYKGDAKYASFCDRCGRGIQQLVPPLCRICGMEIFAADGRDSLCGECLRNPPPYSKARSIVRYEEQVRRLVHTLKYQGEFSVLSGIAEVIRNYDLTEFADIDCIVVVPLHISRLRRRGLNQAAILARLFFADRLALLKPDWLMRIRNTVPQTALGRAARKQNLRGVFRVRPGAHFAGARVCLVDDVFTTGTTVKECSKVIMESGAAEVKVLTFARVNVPRRGRHL